MPSIVSRHFWLISFLASLSFAQVSRSAPAAPTDCVAAGFGVPSGGATAAVVVKWTDNSTDETAWLIEFSSNGGLSYSGGLVASDTTSGTGTIVTTMPLAKALNTPYLFRVIAYNGQYSASSNLAAVTPGLFVVTPSLVPNQVAVNLSWPGVQGVDGYDVYAMVYGLSGYQRVGTAAPDATGYQVNSGLVAGNAHYFVVLPYLGNRFIGQSDPTTLNLDVITSKTGTSGTFGSSLSHTFTHISGYAVLSRGLTWNGQPALPAGLSFNNSSGVLSGSYPPIGNYILKYTVALADGVVLKQDFAVRVRPAAGPPQVGAVIPGWSGIAGSARDTDLAGSFTDPEAESAVRVSTTLGDMDFILFDTATPATVANFKNYVTSGRFADVAFHRSLAGFVIQGGGFKGTGSGSSFTRVVTDPPVVNEPGISNLRGTLSMAKLGGDPDSATSQFFISLANNSANLDHQNAGFTVFGRVAGTGMTVADSIAGLPTRTYNLYLDGGLTPVSFSDFPMNAASAPVTMDQTKLVKILSVTDIPTIRHTVTGNTDPSVATASVIEGQLHLVGLAAGHTTITVTATDLDNLTNTQTVEVDIEDNYHSWASGNVFPGGLDAALENPDGDPLTNLEEYAYFGNPATMDLPPAVGITGVAPAPRFLTLTFPVRKFAAGLGYDVESSDSPGGPWATVWSSGDGFGGAGVVNAVDLADRTVVTIRDSVAIGGQSSRFMRVRVTQQ